MNILKHPLHYHLVLLSLLSLDLQHHKPSPTKFFTTASLFIMPSILPPRTDSETANVPVFVNTQSTSPFHEETVHPVPSKTLPKTPRLWKRCRIVSRS